MNRAALLAVAGLAGIVAASRTARASVGEAAEAVGESINEVFNVLRLSNMRGLSPSLLNDANVRAFLRVIRSGEGTADAGGYSRLFGGASFDGFADHPRRTICKTLRSGGRLCSTAAGAYQFLSSTWDETARIMGLRDFSPASQDLGALGRIAARGALADVQEGRLELALSKVAREWASMPGSPYGQPTITLTAARTIYAAAGGFDVGTMTA